MKKVDRNTLAYLGEDFQFKLVKSLFEDCAMLMLYKDIISEKLFSNDYLARIAGWVLKYYDKYNKIPRYEDAIAYFKEVMSEQEIPLQYMLEYIKGIRSIDTDFNAVERIAGDALKMIHLRNVIEEVQKLTNDHNNVGKVQRTLQNALNTISEDNITVSKDWLQNTIKQMQHHTDIASLKIKALKASNDYLKLRAGHFYDAIDGMNFSIECMKDSLMDGSTPSIKEQQNEMIKLTRKYNAKLNTLNNIATQARENLNSLKENGQ